MQAAAGKQRLASSGWQAAAGVKYLLGYNLLTYYIPLYFNLTAPSNSDRHFAKYH